MPVDQRTIGHFERMLHLRKVPVLGSLPPALLSPVADLSRERLVEPGAVLLREGEPVSSAYYVVDGAVSVEGEGWARRVVSGHELAGLHLLARDEKGLRAVAEAPSLLLEVEAEALFDLFEDEFAILLNVVRDLSRQLIAGLKRDPRWPSVIRSEASAELDLVERIFYLRQARPFTRVSINALAELSRGLVEVRFEPGTVLWEAGHSSDWALLVVEGVARCTVLRGAAFDAGAGSSLGVAEALGDVPRWYTAVVAEPLRGLQSSIEALIDVFEDNLEMALAYMSFMARLILEAGTPTPP
ncbi:MAG TPA: cyclic nucleotide-binding domain-containing protein [Vicinamibacteria bacterium]|jgi:CRP-like cAMP-binding protein